MKYALVVELKRMAVHDGPGIRTTIFLKGCPLACTWCHNPECIDGEKQLIFRDIRCVGCGACVAACSHNAHEIVNGKHLFHRERCTGCGHCVSACYAGALSLAGEEKSTEEIFAQVAEDQDFYHSSGGGITISGGEPLLHPEYCAELLSRCRSANIHTAVDTSGAISWSALNKVLPFTELFLYDFKAADPAVHKQWTGMDNHLILQNLNMLSATGKRIWIRMPMIPGVNMDEPQIQQTAELLRSLPHPPERVELLGYHPFAKDKYRFCGKTWRMPETTRPSASDLEHIANQLRSYGLNALNPLAEE